MTTPTLKCSFMKKSNKNTISNYVKEPWSLFIMQSWVYISVSHASHNRLSFTEAWSFSSVLSHYEWLNISRKLLMYSQLILTCISTMYTITLSSFAWQSRYCVYEDTWTINVVTGEKKTDVAFKDIKIRLFLCEIGNIPNPTPSQILVILHIPVVSVN